MWFHSSRPQKPIDSTTDCWNPARISNTRANTLMLGASLNYTNLVWTSLLSIFLFLKFLHFDYYTLKRQFPKEDYLSALTSHSDDEEFIQSFTCTHTVYAIKIKGKIWDSCGPAALKLRWARMIFRWRLNMLNVCIWDYGSFSFQLIKHTAVDFWVGFEPNLKVFLNYKLYIPLFSKMTQHIIIWRIKGSV